MGQSWLIYSNNALNIFQNAIFHFLQEYIECLYAMICRVAIQIRDQTEFDRRDYSIGCKRRESSIDLGYTLQIAVRSSSSIKWLGKQTISALCTS